MILAMMSGAGEIAFSPFIVPVAGCIMVLGIVIVRLWASLRTREIQGRERLEMIARGIAPPPTVEELALTQSRPVSSQSRRRANIRLTGIVLLASAAGLIAFFIALAAILRERAILSGAASALIPFAVGLGFLIDARHQARDIDAAGNAAPPAPEFGSADTR